MNAPARTFCLVAILAGCLLAAERPAGQTGKAAEAAATQAAGSPAKPADGEGSLLAEDALAEETIPVTAPVLLKKRRKKLVPLLGEGTPLADRVTRIEKDFAGQFCFIQDSRVGQLYLLPCATLEAVEEVRAGSPNAVFSLSGEIYGYRGAYYLMLRSAAVATQPAATTRPGDREPPAERTPSSSPAASQPARPKHAGAEDVARELMKRMPPRPILPKPPPTVSEDAAPANRPLQPGPGQMVVNRLTRLAAPKGTGWFLLTFDADNTIQEPPLRILPNKRLEEMERLSGGGTAPGAHFYVSGEVHHYRGQDYVLLRAVLRKREMGQF